MRRPFLVLPTTAAAVTLLSSCSGSPSQAVPSSSAVAPTTTPGSPSPRPSPTLPVASAYAVKPQKGVSYGDLQKAYTKLAKISGLRGLSLARGAGLRVDLAVPDNPVQRQAVLAILTKLGKVDVAY